MKQAEKKKETEGVQQRDEKEQEDNKKQSLTGEV